MGAAANLASGVKTWDGIEILVDDLCLQICDKTAHGVVNLGPQLCNIERRRFDGGGVLEDERVEIIVFSCAYETIPTGDFSFELGSRNGKLSRNGFDRVEGHNDASLKTALQDAGSDLRLDGRGIAHDKGDVPQFKHLVGAFFSVARFFHEALARFWVNHEPIAD